MLRDKQFYSIHLKKNSNHLIRQNRRMILPSALLVSGLVSLPMVFTEAVAQTANLIVAQSEQPASINVKHYIIGSGSLSQVLTAFAQQAGITLSFTPAQVQGLQSQGLSNSYSVNQALNAIIAGTGLVASHQGNEYVVTREKEGSLMMSPVRVGGSVLAETTEGTGSYTTGFVSTATKLSLAPRETPQSVSVLTDQQIEDQQLLTLDEAVRSIPGLVVNKGDYVGSSGSFSARGFAIERLMHDGLASNLGGNGTFNADNDDLAIYDRVEVVRGATGLATGSGTPSATVNLIRKRPTETAELSLNGTLGSRNDKRILIDGSNALNKSKTIRGRAVASIRDKENFYDNVSDNTQQLYGILEFDLTPDTLLTAGAHWRDTDNDGIYSGLPVNEDGSFLDVPRSTNYGNDFDYWAQNTQTIFAELKHQFNNDWSATLSAITRSQDLDMLFSDIGNVNDGVLYQTTQNYIMDRQQTSLNLNASGEITLLDRAHELAVGLSYRRDAFDAYGGWSADSWTTSAPVVDQDNWDSSTVLMPDIDRTLWTQRFTDTETGVYGVARINLADNLKLILGSRVDQYQNRNDKTGVTYKSDTQLTPYGGVIYDINHNHSTYASWTRIFQPQSVVDINGDVLEPITGTNLEAGVKGEYLNGQLNASLAIFQIKQNNRPIDDIANPNPCPGSSWGYCQRASGEVESKGVELEISGQLRPDWQLSAGYTYVSAEYKKDQDPELVGEVFSPEYPKHQLKFASNYQLPGQFNKWNAGGNLYYQNGVKGDWDESIIEEGYVVLGLNAGYEFNKNLDVRLNINNIFDKHYYENLGWSSGGNRPGEPRNFALTVAWHL